jgi:hypothetical protein
MSTTTLTRTTVMATTAVTPRVAVPVCSYPCSNEYAANFTTFATAIPANAMSVKWHRKDMAAKKAMHATARRGDRLP